ncbi:MAG: DUF1446 domain-containing protein [Deltaproteobacteria bacterium]|nr:DUF1446 domain-containing protein [Deltaproteobacteria bacterium]
MATYNDRLIIANCSGFYGDRLSAAREMVQGGPIDVLTGDYLAELTMAILLKKQKKDPGGGFASTFLTQMEEIMGECLDRKIRVVTNAGGLNPAGMAAALEKTAERLGLKPKIAYIEGDNLLPRLKELHEKGEALTHLDKGIDLADSGAEPITANAYMGGWGIAAALEKGADIVVTGRVADAAVVAGPAAWHFGWEQDDWDRLSGAYAAGHIIECGAQATGGNYAFFEEVPSFNNVGFPIAEVYEDGSSVITKHPGTGGLVSVGTVTAQLLYEISTPGYLTPDVIARFDTLELVQEAVDRVRVQNTKGQPLPETTKVCINTLGLYRNMISVSLTGLDIEKKAAVVENAMFDSIGGRDQFQDVHVQLLRTDKPDPGTNDEAVAHLNITVMDSDPKKVGRSFTAKFIELALANIPGFFGGWPSPGMTRAIVHWPALVSTRHIQQKVVVGEETMVLDTPAPPDTPIDYEPAQITIPQVPEENRVQAPLGRVFGARSGDKGGNANLGIWGKTPEAYAFLAKFLTIEKFKELLPDCAVYDIDRYEMPNLLALNFYIHGILGDGIAASLRRDGQAKSLGEYLRMKVVEMPGSILPPEARY